MRQMTKDEGNKNIIGVLTLLAGARSVDDRFCIVTDLARARVQLLKLVARQGARRSREQGAFLGKNVVELRLQSIQLRTMPKGDRALISRLIEQYRRLFELIKKEHHCAEQQNEKLHRHLNDRIEKQPEPAGAERPTGEITLYLRLIRAEIRQGQEKPAENA